MASKRTKITRMDYPRRCEKCKLSEPQVRFCKNMWTECKGCLAKRQSAYRKGNPAFLARWRAYMRRYRQRRKEQLAQTN